MCSFILCLLWMFLSSIKEIKRSISKGISIIYYWKKLIFSKIVGKKQKNDVLRTRWKKKNISHKKNLKECTSFEEQNGTRYIRINVYFGIIVFWCRSSTKPCLRYFWICLAREIKGFYQSFLRNEVDFGDIMNISPNILAKS